uniref:Uncharacterized protein n=1 Tax=Romanomermis culicivorax TaxID=13658 RepID=A0A915KFN8_ROMCU
MKNFKFEVPMPTNQNTSSHPGYIQLAFSNGNMLIFEMFMVKPKDWIMFFSLIHSDYTILISYYGVNDWETETEQWNVWNIETHGSELFLFVKRGLAGAELLTTVTTVIESSRIIGIVKSALNMLLLLILITSKSGRKIDVVRWPPTQTVATGSLHCWRLTDSRRLCRCRRAQFPQFFGARAIAAFRTDESRRADRAFGASFS